MNKMKIEVWRNNRNENKYFNLKHYKDGHYYFKPYMAFSNGVINNLGQRLNHDRYFRTSKRWFDMIQEDYTKIGEVEYYKAE